jgi:hypothetical protein
MSLWTQFQIVVPFFTHQDHRTDKSLVRAIEESIKSEEMQISFKLAIAIDSDKEVDQAQATEFITSRLRALRNQAIELSRMAYGDAVRQKMRSIALQYEYKLVEIEDNGIKFRKATVV